ncbi:MAG: hypothetical protein KAQ94_06305 [Arcobacteraceae bacterium]|nr:hypothetical protein [Arcobacteraceae bacterium]
MKNKIWIVVAILALAIFGNEIYKQVNKKPKSAKATRLDCQKTAVTFEKVVKKDLIKNLQQTLKSGDYTLDVWADKAKYMKSVMFEYVDIKVIHNDIKQKIKIYPSNHIIAEKTNDVFIDVMVYENDKKDPGKKTKKSKLYAGYLEFAFKVDKKVVYKIQIDFMDLKGNDIPDRISCVVKSVMSLGE